MFPRGCNRGTISCMERKRVPEGWGKMAKQVKNILGAEGYEEGVCRNLNFDLLCLVSQNEV